MKEQSITSLTNIKEVRNIFNDWFVKPPFSGKNRFALIHPPITDKPQLLGTAFDYLLRFKIQYFNSKAIASDWVAEKALLLLRNKHIATENVSKKLIKSWLKEGELLIGLAKENYLKFLEDGEITNDLLRSCFHLAKIDAFYRPGYIRGRIDDVHPRDIQDLLALISNIKMEQFQTKDVCLLNPTFSNATEITGVRADADLVLDDTLIDIKTVKNLKFERGMFNQLMGYYLLSKIGGIDGAPEDHELHKIGIYFSRYEYLHVIDVKDVFNQSKLSSILDWFRNFRSSGR